MTSDTQTIKYRLIGAAVILLALVLGWWLFLDHDVKRYQDTKRSIPEPLLIERFEVAEPQPVAEITPAEVKPAPAKPLAEEPPAQLSNVPAASKPAAAKPATPYTTRDEQGMTEAWVVQAASFENQDNARQLQQRMLNARLPAYVKVFNLPEGKRYRVLLGPKLNRQQAESLLPRLQQEFRINGQILRYQPGFEQ